jgi:sugar transferase (PEP-CTERM/EpsH1 system associated)
VTSRFPFPVEKGDKLRAYHQIRLLSQRHEVHLVALSHGPVPQEAIEAMSVLCASVQIFRVKRWLLPVQMLMGWLEGLPLQVSFFLDRTIKRAVQYHIIQVQPDHVICQLIRAAPYVRALPFPKTLDYMDVFSEGMYQLARKYRLFGFFLRQEANRLAAYERTVYKDFDRHTIISRQDRDRLKLATAERVAVVPNGVDERFSAYAAEHGPAHDIVFVGNLGYGPNIGAATLLVDKIQPGLLDSGHRVSVLLAGARPSRKVRALARRPGVTVSGWMADIREAYAAGRIFAAPMMTGLGLQNKILEAMAMGLPCVTTTMVNNAIGARAGEEILIADDAEGFIRAIVRLLEDSAFRERVAAGGRAFVLANYGWADQVGKLEEVISSKNEFISI